MTTKQKYSNKTLVDSGALKLALNTLRRLGKNDIAEEVEKTAIRLDPILDKITNDITLLKK